MNTKDTKLVRFDAFMKHALHDPDKGYYARNIQTVGATGDFSTTATLSAVLGKAIAASALDWARTNKAPLHFIEIGGGDGSLAESVIKSIPFMKRWRLHYHIVDSSAPLTENQQQREISKKVSWHSEMKSALDDCKGIAFIFSNELVDAFPVRLFRKSNNHWNELYLHHHEEHFCPCADTLPESSAIDYAAHPKGQRIEVHQSYREWLQDWLPSWKQGQLLTIDYGDTHPEVYYRMPEGTLRAYSHHQRITGKSVYQNPGKQDITADVNFTDLITWGKQDGLETVSLINQHEYLTPHVSKSPEDQFLIHPDGAGSAFKVFLQQRKP
ncbi:MAG: SAM-dependent MidA family methyltransferase [Cryomorphaceae bacterium]|jgi:SAM-dependent MidA family methyltransferase